MVTDTKQETQTWWRVYLGELTSHQVERVTAKTVVWTAGRRSPRVSLDERWFDNESEAVEYCRAKLKARVVYSCTTAERALARLEAFNEAHPLPATEEHDG